MFATVKYIYVIEQSAFCYHTFVYHRGKKKIFENLSGIYSLSSQWSLPRLKSMRKVGWDKAKEEEKKVLFQQLASTLHRYVSCHVFWFHYPLEHLKILIFKVIFQCKKMVESFPKKFFGISWVLYFLKMCPIFVGSVHNFGRSDGDII